MAGLLTKFASQKQDWQTPPDLFGPLHSEFRFTLDAAAHAGNALLPRFLGPEQDAMKASWSGERCWLNPPFGQGYGLKQWVRKAYLESRRGALVVMLIPARTNTEWFHEICLRYAEVRFVRGRPRFVGAAHGLPQPLCLVIFRPPE